MREEDLTSLSLADESFSLVFCSHVLEHIPDDVSAISEMRRVLRPGGVALVLVPIDGAVTDEEPLEDPEQRFQRYGLEDHVRMYGLDVLDRLSQQFEVTHRISDEWSDQDRARYGLGLTEHAFLCRVP